MENKHWKGLVPSLRFLLVTPSSFSAEKLSRSLDFSLSNFVVGVVVCGGLQNRG